MNDVLVLTFVIDRFERNELAVVLSFPDGKVRHVNLKELQGYSGRTIVTHDAPILIQALRARNQEISWTLVDIEEALRLRGQIARDQGGEKLWRVWKSASPYFEVDADAKRMSELIEARIEPPVAEELGQLTARAAKALTLLWKQVVLDLKKQQEWQRFWDIEVPVQQIFHYRHYWGLELDRTALRELIGRAESEKFSLFRQLSAKLGLSVLGVKDSRLAELLAPAPEERDAKVDGFALEDWLKLASFQSNWASVLLDYIRAKRDALILREADSAPGRLYPRFQVHGTITSRILVSEPRLQQLRKRFRGIVAADAGAELTYLDYAQFEPGILGVLSQDEVLLSAYRAGDLYTTFAATLDSDDPPRELAKRVFLAYLYGMNRERIAELLSREEAQNKRDSVDRVSSFFSQFRGVEQFRDAAIKELTKEGSVRTMLGNARRRSSAGALTYKEERWAMNHIIQGTASLIFKRALQLIAERFGPASILLPMHDAVVLQFLPAKIGRAEFEAEVAGLMQRAFGEYCPQLEIRVTASTFAAANSGLAVL